MGLYGFFRWLVAEGSSFFLRKNGYGKVWLDEFSHKNLFGVVLLLTNVFIFSENLYIFF